MTMHTALRYRSAPLLVAPRAPIECEPIEKGRAEDTAEIERLASKLEPKLQAAIFGALQKQHDAVTLSKLVEAIKSGSAANVMAVLDEAVGSAYLAGIEQALLEAATGAGIYQAAKIARIARVDFTFGVLNPGLVQWLQSYSLGLIKQIDQTTREGVRTALIDGMAAGKSPIATARQIKQVVGLTSAQSKAVANYRKELETFHLRRKADAFGLGNKIDRVNGRQVFKPDEDGAPKDGIDARRLRDFRFDGQLSRAMKTGKPLAPEKIDEMVEAYARKYRKFRSETIARTEAMRTTNMGVQDSWRQAIIGGKVPEQQVRRQWIIGKDERTCTVCNQVPQLNPKRGVKFGQPFATPNGPVMLPPIHPSCRCTVFIRMFEASQLASDGSP